MGQGMGVALLNEWDGCWVSPRYVLLTTSTLPLYLAVQDLQAEINHHSVLPRTLLQSRLL